MVLIRMVYYSTVATALTKSDLKQILHSSQINNKLYGVTGALLFNREKFVQVLEGRRDEVAKLYDRICRDRRHSRPVLTSLVEITERAFGQWTMAYLGEDLFTAELCQRHCGGPEFIPDTMNGAALYAMIVDMFARLDRTGVAG